MPSSSARWSTTLAEQLGDELPKGKGLETLSPYALLGGDDLTFSRGVKHARLLFAGCIDGGECVWPDDGHVETARRLRLDHVTSEVCITIEHYVAVLGIITNKTLQRVVWSVVYVAHKSVQALVACPCPFGHFSRATAEWP